ncbi:YadA-like family protein [Salmonella enterica]
MKATYIKLAVLAAAISFSLSPAIAFASSAIGNKSDVILGSKENSPVTINKADIENVVLHDVVTTDAGIDLSAQKITGLAEGTAGTDAVNVNQLNLTDAKATDAQTAAKQAQTWATTAQNAANQAEQNANHYTDNKFNQLSNSSNERFSQLDKKVNALSKRVDRGLASSAALSGLFQPYGVGKFNLSAGVGGYGGESAIAVGTGYRFNENVAAKAGISSPAGNMKMMYNASINFEW